MSLSHPWFIASQDVDRAVEALDAAQPTSASDVQYSYQAGPIHLQPADPLPDSIAQHLSELGGYESGPSLPSASQAAPDGYTAASDAPTPTLQEAIEEGRTLRDRLDKAIGATKTDLQSLKSTQRKTATDDPDLQESLSHTRKNLERYRGWKERIDRALEQVQTEASRTQQPIGSSASELSYSLSHQHPDQDVYPAAPTRPAVQKQPYSSAPLDRSVSQNPYVTAASGSYDPERAADLDVGAILAEATGMEPPPTPDLDTDPVYSTDRLAPPAPEHIDWSAGISEGSLSSYEDPIKDHILAEHRNQQLNLQEEASHAQKIEYGSDTE